MVLKSMAWLMRHHWLTLWVLCSLTSMLVWWWNSEKLGSYLINKLLMGFGNSWLLEFHQSCSNALNGGLLKQFSWCRDSFQLKQQQLNPLLSTSFTCWKCSQMDSVGRYLLLLEWPWVLLTYGVLSVMLSWLCWLDLRSLLSLVLLSFRSDLSLLMLILMNRIWIEWSFKSYQSFP